MSDSQTTPQRHSAWETYYVAEREWRTALDQTAQAHRRMQDAADELEQAGEMQRDYR